MLVPSCSTSIRFLKEWQLEHNSRPIFGGLITHVNCSCSWFNPPHCFKRKSQKKTRTCLTPQYFGSCVTPFVVRRSLLGSGTLHPKLLLAACCAWAMWGWTNTTCGWNQRNEIFFFRSHWGCKHFSAPGGLKQTCVLFLPRKDGILPFWCLCILLYSELGNGNNLLFELSIGYQPPNYHRLLGPNNWSMFSWNIHLPTPNLWQPGRAHPKRPTRLGGESLKDVACQDTLFV